MTSRTSTLLAGTAGFVFIIATQQAMAEANINVTATVEEECLFTTTNVDIAFGVYDDALITKTGSFEFDCPSGKSLTFSIGGGVFHVSGDGSYELPNASDGTSNPLRFFVLNPDNQVWTNGYTTTSAGGVQSRTFEAQLPAGQFQDTAILPGDYSEQLTMTMTVNPPTS